MDRRLQRFTRIFYPPYANTNGFYDCIKDANGISGERVVTDLISNNFIRAERPHPHTDLS